MAGLYIHIPFCRSKCAYCDFYSSPRRADTDGYIDAVLREFDLRADEISERYTTLYIGGGTPSMLSPESLDRLLHGIGRRAGITGMEEVTIEANPEDITQNSLSLYASLGINRVSIGVQSFNDTSLSAIGRSHSSQAAYKALDALASSGMNYNADLIYGQPGQSMEMWERDLEQMLHFSPPHLSAYLLSYEPGTRLYAMLANGRISEAPEELAIGMYRLLCELTVKNGYGHYEISNFAKVGKQAVHNSLYWNYTPYLGLGASAHSFDGKIRRMNPCNMKVYMNTISAGATACSQEDETDGNRYNDYIITSLRTSAGYSPQFALERFGSGLTTQFNRNCIGLPSGMLELLPSGNMRIPEREWLKSDSILRELIVD